MRSSNRLAAMQATASRSISRRALVVWICPTRLYRATAWLTYEHGVPNAVVIRQNAAICAHCSLQASSQAHDEEVCCLSILCSPFPNEV